MLSHMDHTHSFQITPLYLQSMVLFLEEKPFLSMRMMKSEQWSSLPGLWRLQSFDSLGKAFLHPSEDLFSSAL